ncbi:MAG TPA: DUF1097 domain-containing protein [Methylovirgula sp.]|jgi:hypothetical protein
MSHLTALSISIAVLGAVWAFLALGPLAAYTLVWVGFIAWGCFFAAGGDNNALVKTIVGTIYGAIIGWIALAILANVTVALPSALWPAIVVGVTVFFLVIVASIDVLSVVPANVYGYAAIVGYATLGKGDVMGASASNPIVPVVISLILGALFGYASGQLANMIARK